jgi:hypothetical protein
MLVLKSFLFSFFGACVSVAAFAGTDPLESLKTFSEFPSVDLRGLHEGNILGEPGSLMNFPQGISAQTCFAVPVTAAEAARRLQVWDPSLHAKLKAIEFHTVSEPCEPADFKSLSLQSSQRSFRWLLDETFATTAGKSELNLTRDEARQLADCAKSNPDQQAVGACWAKLLLERATAFQRRGFAGVPPYEATGETISPAAQLRAMLREQPAVAREFAPLLRQCGVLGDEETATLKPFHYWGLYEANHHATFNLGVVYLLPLGDRYQLLDAQYYVSGTYYTFVTLYEIWPTRVGERPAALVWRGDFIAAPTLAFARGFDRLAYGSIMLQELKKAIRAFQDDVKANP